MDLLSVQFICLWFYYLAIEYTVTYSGDIIFANAKPVPLILTLKVLNIAAGYRIQGFWFQHFGMFPE